mmetsp:Transcript_4965/g.7270  ORF Transcript_4965/g.7270 Transcript_4965/m.7270 type:complete len:282 (+) Transcript_4965:132-977(+)
MYFMKTIIAATITYIHPLSDDTLGIIGHSNKRLNLIILLSTILRVNKGVQILNARRRALLGLLHLLLHLLANLLLHLLQFLGITETSIDHSLLEEFEGVTRGPSISNLITVSVGGTGIGHTVTMVAVRRHLHIHGTIALGTVLLHEAHTFLHSKNVHTIHLNTRNVVAHLIILRMRRVTIDGGAHTVLIVLNTKDHRQLPQHGHVGAFPDLTLIGSSITITGNGHRHILTRWSIVLIGKGQTGSYGDLSSDDALTAVEIVCLVVKVHTATLRLGQAVLEAK